MPSDVSIRLRGLLPSWEAARGTIQSLLFVTVSLAAQRVALLLRQARGEHHPRSGHNGSARLGRYAPRAVRDCLEQAREPRTGLFELSVMFVDLRGYSGYAERRNPKEVFATINRYTRAVSGIVAKFGGSVIEFNGDGMLAIFGSTSARLNKEEAALQAALRIVRTRRLARKLTIAVGIATGPAYVGTILAVDRAVWGATGDTTNLASRLQSLAGELDAAVVIDARTLGRTRLRREGFVEKRAVTIRGRIQLEDVFFLPVRQR